MNQIINVVSVLTAIFYYVIVRELDTTLALIYAIGAAIVVQIYFIPARIAEHKKHRNKTAIFFLNALGGWTGLLWITAMIWAVYVTKDQENGLDSQA